MTTDLVIWPGRELAFSTRKGFPELQSRLVAARALAFFACCWRLNSWGSALEDCSLGHESDSRNCSVFCRLKVGCEGAAVLRHKDLATSIVAPDGWQETLALARDYTGLEGHGHRQETLASVGWAQTYLEGENLWVGDRGYSRQGGASPAEQKGRCAVRHLAGNGRDECREPMISN